MGRSFAGCGPNSVDIGRIWPDLGRSWPKRNRSNLGRLQPIWAPESAGKFDHSGVGYRQHCGVFDRLWWEQRSDLADICQSCSGMRQLGPIEMSGATPKLLLHKSGRCERRRTGAIPSSATTMGKASDGRLAVWRFRAHRHMVKRGRSVSRRVASSSPL